MDDLTRQIDEIEALVAIYGNDWTTEDEENRAYSINIKDGDNFVKLDLKLPHNYPSTLPPIYELSAPHMTLAEKQQIFHLLDQIYLSCIGENVIFSWIEAIRTQLQAPVLASPIENEPTEEENDIINVECPEIHHGDLIVDRKSSFQGHAAVVTSILQVKIILKKLLEMKKIETATHNMYAYRIYHEATNNYIQDCEDDGESQAGKRLLHLLQILDAKNVIVVVSRWYGGIHLGSQRFRHINNAARQVLVAGNFKIKDNSKK